MEWVGDLDYSLPDGEMEITSNWSGLVSKRINKYCHSLRRFCCKGE